MKLVTATGGRRKILVRQDAVSQLRDVGDRLEFVLGRYARIVREVTDDTVSVPDLSGRVALINSHLVFVAERLQELFILEHELTRAESLAAGKSRSGRREAFPRPVVRAMA